MTKKITTIIFDCFGVVIDPIIFSWYADNVESKGYSDPNLIPLIKKFDLGEVSEDELCDYFSNYEILGGSSKEKIKKELDSYLKINEDLVKIISLLKKSGYKVAILSNANGGVFERRIFPTYPHLKDLFDEIVISSDVKMVKPNADIFLLTLERLGSKAEECVFIDDSERNVEASISLGMEGILYKNMPDFTEKLNALL